MRVLQLAAAAVIVLGAARADARPHKGAPQPPPPPPEEEKAPPPPPATPPGDTYAIASIDIAGDADPELKNAIAASVARGLDQANVPHVAPEVVAQALRSRPDLVGCSSTTCLAKLGAIVGASRFLTVRVDTAGAAYNIELTVLTVDGPVARKTAACEVCTMSDLGELLAKKADELITQPAAQPVSVTLATMPAGGDIAVSAGEAAGPLRPVGKAPAQVTLAPGTYLVEVKLSGYEVLRKSITVSDNGDPQSFDLALEPAPVDEPARFHRMKWAVAGGAVAALVTGVIVLSFDGKQACGSPPCTQLDRTTPQGLVLVGVGVVAGAAAGWMFWHDKSEAHHARAMVAPTAGGAAAALTLDF